MVKKIIDKISYYLFTYTSSIWFYQRLREQSEPLDAPTGITITFHYKDKANLIDWLKENHNTFPWMYIKKEIDEAEKGDHIYVSINRNEKIIGYLKVGLENTYINDFDLTVFFPENTAFIYDTFVLPQYRGKNISLYAIRKTMAHLKKMGLSVLWCHIEKWNKASIKIYQKAGFQAKGNIMFCRIFRYPIYIKNGYIPLTRLESFIKI